MKYIIVNYADAEPMTFGEFKSKFPAFVGANLERQDEDDGYLVAYNKGAQNEYVSWRPKSEFESVSHKNDTHIDRMNFEQRELQVRLSDLCAFMNTAKFTSLTPANRILLRRQKAAMMEYRDILDVRIEHMDFQITAFASPDHT